MQCTNKIININTAYSHINSTYPLELIGSDSERGRDNSPDVISSGSVQSPKLQDNLLICFWEDSNCLFESVNWSCRDSLSWEGREK